MAQKKKPNFKPFGNKKPAKTPTLGQMLFGTPSKKFNKSSQHHDSTKGNRGNGGGKQR
jgi:hypothetical protein